MTTSDNDVTIPNVRIIVQTNGTPNEFFQAPGDVHMCIYIYIYIYIYIHTYIYMYILYIYTQHSKTRINVNPSLINRGWGSATTNKWYPPNQQLRGLISISENHFTMPKGSFQSFQRVVLRYIVVIGNPTGLMLRTCRAWEGLGRSRQTNFTSWGTRLKT